MRQTPSATTREGGGLMPYSEDDPRGYRLDDIERETRYARRMLSECEAALDRALATHDVELIEVAADRRQYWRDVLDHCEQDEARYVTGQPLL